MHVYVSHHVASHTLSRVIRRVILTSRLVSLLLRHPLLLRHRGACEFLRLWISVCVARTWSCASGPWGTRRDREESEGTRSQRTPFRWSSLKSWHRSKTWSPPELPQRPRTRCPVRWSPMDPDRPILSTASLSRPRIASVLFRFTHPAEVV